MSRLLHIESATVYFLVSTNPGAIIDTEIQHQSHITWNTMEQPVMLL